MVLTALVLVLSPISYPHFTIRSFAENKPVIVVIDPGHGGGGNANLGAVYNALTEKDLTLQLARALKAELDRYDNVSVILTRTEDTPLTLEQRAVFAKENNADFLFSIHFNASPIKNEHIFYGSEVWTSAFSPYYQKGYDFGQLVMGEWNGLGLYQKGVKTRIGKKGDDYYGIIRQSVKRNIPCVILEHAYLDCTTDASVLKTAGFIEKLAVADATAMAKYFKLRSPSGADYSGFTYTNTLYPAGNLYQDVTGPDVCSAKVLAADPARGNILVELTTSDKQSPVIYFSYSYDGGNTFSPLQMWDRTKNTQSFNVVVPPKTVNPKIVVRSYNNYEQMSESNLVDVTGIF